MTSPEPILERSKVFLAVGPDADPNEIAKRLIKALFGTPPRPAADNLEEATNDGGTLTPASTLQGFC